jgi:hypothetical protein
MNNRKTGINMVKTLIIWFWMSLTAVAMPLSADWKKDIQPYFEKVYQYDAVVKYLETNMPQIPAAEKSQAIIILCYAYGEKGDRVSEEKWVGQLFEIFGVSDPDLEFLSPRLRVKIYEYVQRWKRRYPGIKAIHISRRSRDIEYFEPPQMLYLDIGALAPSEITVVNIDKNRQTIFSGLLQKGLNTVAIPFDPLFMKQKETQLEIRLKSGFIQSTRKVLIYTDYRYPPGIRFEPISGTVALMGMDFKAEQSTNTYTEIHRYFDKKHFRKKALIHLAIGTGLILLDLLAVRNTMNADSTSPKTKALMNGIDKTATAFSIGLSLKGIIHIFRSFKKETREVTRTTQQPEAVTYNNRLRQKIREARKKIGVSFRLKSINSES